MLSRLGVPRLCMSGVCFTLHGTLRRSVYRASIIRPVVGIKRETVNLWEQRSPLTPSQVQQLIRQHGVRVLVQPSNRRCFTSSEYEAAGAEIAENLEDATLILGVKRPADLRPHDLLQGKTYAFFTHTIKAQPANMKLLDTLLERSIRIIDYECMVNGHNKRVVAFGKHAGMAGTIDIIHGLGIRLLALGHRTPFMHVSIAHNYHNLNEAQQAIRLVGYELALGRLPASIGPLVFVINGDGNVAQGAEKILSNLPAKSISPRQLQHVANQGETNVIYLCKVNPSHYMEHKDGKPFVMEEYFRKPEDYKSNFINTIAPYTSVLINATYWDSRIDRILTRENVKSLLDVKTNVNGSPLDEACPTLPYRMIAICDISADSNGSVEFTDECTTIDEPFVLYDPRTDKEKQTIAGDGILMCSIDNLPAQLPFEASEHFGTALLPYLPDMVKSDATQPFDEYNAGPVVKNAIIASNGALTPKFQYIDSLRKKTGISHTSTSSKKVLILGAGYVVPPVIEYLSRDKSVELTVVSNVYDELSELARQYPSILARNVNVLEDNQILASLIQNSDLVLSLIPWRFHPTVVTECVKQKRNLLTASYCTPNLKEMESRIQQAGITAVMEIGLDPGIDHLLTKECIDDVRAMGGRVISYRSYTGGLPAPENSSNPLRYKFSWSPEAALSTVMNGAKYLENGKIKEVPADGSLMKMAAPMNIFPGFNLEGYPNRDSTRYIGLYGLTGCETVIRGTLRYTGYANAVLFMLELGLLQAHQEDHLKPGAQKFSWRELICQKLGLHNQLTGNELRRAVLSKLEGNQAKYDCLNELGFLSEDTVAQAGTPLASTALQLSKYLSYGPNERDLIIMAHELIIDWPDRKQREQRKVSLVAYGKAGQGKAGLAMSRTVGIPAAIAAKMILDGEISEKGIVLPLKPEIYKPILEKLKTEGIEAHETSTFCDMS
ncbi:hypothetical protein CRM22_005128 [Opisthorchis felineus]|uniref:Uncharacterized protein n=1 Tax=Opisthorchis felineus TaxID=147828 RepID=A0A4S2LSL1_OPIFE|nr:hypothetical protein CRM22_005128 [Opisthorchis felineus]